MSKERPQPYVGVSGVTNEYQQYYLMDQFVWKGLDIPPAERKIGLGVKAVHKTQYLDIENKYGKEWYPVGEEAFAGAMDPPHSWALGVAQTYLDIEHVHDAEYRKEFVDRICRRGKEWLNAIQFDLLPWHEDEQMLTFVEEVKADTGHTIILQAHGEAMQDLGPEGVARKLGNYASAIDYVLFDASHGKGVRMNPDALEPFIYAGYASGQLTGTGFGVAGGLSADVVREDLPFLVEKYPDISWDAEGQLHPVGEDGKRPLNTGRVSEYLEASSEILRQV